MVKLFGFEFGRAKPPASTPVVAVDQMQPYAGPTTGTVGASSNYSWYDGDKFFGGFGTTQIQQVDYWTLRARSAQLFQENLYARGIVRRLVTNEINTGLTPEAEPDEDILGLSEETLAAWTEDVETRFDIWGRDPNICDWKMRSTFGEIQRMAKLEAYVNGDILVVLRQHPRTRLPQVQLISGDKVRTPMLTTVKSLRKGHVVEHGVEMDKRKRVVAYWVRQDDGKFKRLPAFGEKSGRRIAWLVFGTDKRMDEVRGQPLLAIVLQSLKEIDRYRDSVQRKAVVNSMLAMFIEKTQDKMGTLPATGGAVRRDQVSLTESDGGQRAYSIAQQIPGLVIEELQMGEKPVAFNSSSTDINFAAFETAVIQAVAWANEIPPEILTLAFSNNYSASQAAINEFKIYLNKVWAEFGENFCQPIYNEWLVSQALQQKISAPGLVEAWRNARAFELFGAWTLTAWYGSIKPSTDMLKQAKGSQLLVAEGWSNNAREARTLTGTKYARNMKRIKRENELKAEALRPLAEFKQEFGEPLEEADPAGGSALEALVKDEVEAQFEDGA